MPGRPQATGPIIRATISFDRDRHMARHNSCAVEAGQPPPLAPSASPSFCFPAMLLRLAGAHTALALSAARSLPSNDFSAIGTAHLGPPPDQPLILGQSVAQSLAQYSGSISGSIPGRFSGPDLLRTTRASRQLSASQVVATPAALAHSRSAAWRRVSLRFASFAIAILRVGVGCC